MADENYVPFGNAPVFVPDEPLAEMTPSFSTYFENAAGNVLRDSPTSSLFRATELAGANAEQGGFDEFGVFHGGMQAVRRTVAPEDARAKAEEAGVTVDFGDSHYTPEAVDIMIDRARKRTVRDVVVNAYDPSWGTQLGVSLVTSLADPLNIGAAFIPFVGEARYAAILEGAATFGRRELYRAGLGAVEGLAGSLLVEPLIAGAAMQEGREYTLADSLYNLAFGTAFGAGMHAASGAIKEKLFRRRVNSEPVQTPADVVERLPVEINEAALRGAISDLIHGRAVQAGELIDSLIDQNPQIKSAISVGATLRRDGPDLDDIPGRIAYWEQNLTSLKEKAPKPLDFLSWVRQQGGVKDTDGTLAAVLGDVSHLKSSVYISKRGAAKAKRGVTLDELLAQAKQAGYAENMHELTAAFRPGAATVSRNAEKALQARESLAAWAARLEAESGVGKNRPLSVKARAIAGREQHLLASERARVSNAVDALMGRKEDYKAIAEGPVIKEVPEYVPEPAPKAATTAEGSAKAPEAASAKEEKPAAPVYTERQVQKAIETSIKVNDDNAVPTDRVLKDYLPGMSKNKFDKAVKAIQKRRPNLVKKTGKDGTEVILFGAMSKEMKEAESLRLMKGKVDAVRRVLADQYPGLAGKGPFFVNEIFGPRMRTVFNIGEAEVVKYINRLAAEGKVELDAQATSSANPPRKIGRINAERLYSDDKGVDIRITFKEDVPPQPKRKAVEKAEGLEPSGQQIDLPPAMVEKVETPPAPLNALKSAEIVTYEAQFKAVEAAAQKQFDAIAKTLPPETALRLKAQLEKINAEQGELENVYNTAVQCLLNPES